MLLRVFSFLSAGVLAFSPFVAFAEDAACLNDEDAILLFNSEELKTVNGYTESAIGSVELQKKFPQTYMFGQAKFVSNQKKTHVKIKVSLFVHIPIMGVGSSFLEQGMLRLSMIWTAVKQTPAKQSLTGGVNGRILVRRGELERKEFTSALKL